MPVGGKEDEEVLRITIVETGLLEVIVIVYHVRLIFVFRCAAHMVDDAESFRSLHCPLEINVMIVALAIALLQAHSPNPPHWPQVLYPVWDAYL